MAKIFDVQDWLKNHPNRNNFDLTHKVHGSYKFGTLYPFMCKPVVPTDSFRIDTAISARFMPMPFPTQSNMRCVFHYFYVRTKNIWKNFPNWVQGLEEHTPPFINQPNTFFKTGSLADYLDIPTNFVRHASSETVSDVKIAVYGVPAETMALPDYVIPSGDVFQFASFNYISFLVSDFRASFDRNTPYLGSSFQNRIPLSISASVPSDIVDGYYPVLGYLVVQGDRAPELLHFQRIPNLISTTASTNGLPPNGQYLIIDSNNNVCYNNVYTNDQATGKVELLGLDGINDYLDSIGSTERFTIAFLFPIELNEDTSAITFQYSFGTSAEMLVPVSEMVTEVAKDNAANPYYNSNYNYGTDTIKVSALPFRAYESIYNAFYRNSQGVQPFQVGGVTKYNQYNTTTDDGADTTEYTLMQRNWELDAYTSCLISPQQGNVPYVGITEVSALGRMSVETPDGETATVRLSDNGDGVEISNLHGETQAARAYALRAASSGFTIPEFREANALQRFLEMNIRKGYKYIDFIEGHFGKKPTYSEMDMPEFIGGFSQRISVNDISNTNGVDTDTLGAIAGQARAIGGSKHGITHYFDDFGFVVGIMCIVPDNAYNSVLPKHYNLQNPLDMYFPEFSQLSYMPLTYEELCPVQSHFEHGTNSNKKLTDVFGYQRPNHDLVWYPDTVHGEFRNPLNGIGNSVICRNFATRPELGNDFLTIKPSETDTIFNYTLGSNDICLGEIVVKISAKRPVPRLVVPSIS